LWAQATWKIVGTGPRRKTVCHKGTGSSYGQRGKEPAKKGQGKRMSWRTSGGAGKVLKIGVLLAGKNKEGRESADGRNRRVVWLWNARTGSILLKESRRPFKKTSIFPASPVSNLKKEKRAE